ncbi:hypothetical protein HAX54_038392 [Datura stramonium]|uniref:Uncharacterized protein n=1 Tax=Datura stramonium TaxID=4076 RepID=A0ABS8VLD3_DATST|nr:hypothetical protein [Datura stramonium]
MANHEEEEVELHGDNQGNESKKKSMERWPLKLGQMRATSVPSEGCGRGHSSCRVLDQFPFREHQGKGEHLDSSCYQGIGVRGTKEILFLTKVVMEKETATGQHSFARTTRSGRMGLVIDMAAMYLNSPKLEKLRAMISASK